MGKGFDTQIKRALPKITAYFNSSNQNVFRHEDFDRILRAHVKDWTISSNISTIRFIELLINQKVLKQHCFKSPYTHSTRYTWGDFSLFALIQSLRQYSYFTHQSALRLHGLLGGGSNNYYLNYEQPKKYTESTLSQERIDFALSQAHRKTTNIAKYKNIKVHMLSGKHTGHLNVITMCRSGQKIHTTDLERTMIDIAVRPTYSGGVKTVLDMYKKASSKLSVNKLIEILKKMNYIYPYHQCIGFLIEHSNCYQQSEYEKLKQFGLEFDFYLCHNIKRKEFSNNWKLFYPSFILKN